MDKLEFDARYDEYRRSVEDYLGGLFTDRPHWADLYDSMRYSLLAGGKRIRPVLTLETARLCGLDWHAAIPVACALELVHTYSLIHDDLPSMDNDDYRRGRLTNHKVFGDAMALLAGDGLLTQAFEVMLEQRGVDPKVLLDVVQLVAKCAGPAGMVGGQALDITSEDKPLTLEQMKQLHEAKTGAMFVAAVRGGAMLGGADGETLRIMTRFASLFGLAFQITDDILDVEGDAKVMGKPAHSDEKLHKSTYVSLFGLEKAKEMAADTLKQAEETLAPLGEKAQPLVEITRYLYNRKK